MIFFFLHSNNENYIFCIMVMSICGLKCINFRMQKNLEKMPSFYLHKILFICFYQYRYWNSILTASVSFFFKWERWLKIINFSTAQGVLCNIFNPKIINKHTGHSEESGRHKKKCIIFITGVQSSGALM